jgi:hypothetical protein
LPLFALPAVYCLVKVHRKKRKEAIQRQQAEVAAARARAQSRLVKPKSFTLSQTSHNIMVRTGLGPGSIASSRYNLGTAVSSGQPSWQGLMRHPSGSHA